MMPDGLRLTNVPPATANVLAYGVLGVVAIYLITGLTVTLYFRSKYRKAKAAQPEPEGPSQHQG